MAKIQNFPIDSGKGIFFITHWSYETAPVSNENLSYVFEGLTDDGNYHILAEMSVAVNFLPETSSENYKEYMRKYSFYNFDSIDEIKKKRYEKYIADITHRLENLTSKELNPNLKELEKIISSLKIEK